MIGYLTKDFIIALSNLKNLETIYIQKDNNEEIDITPLQKNKGLEILCV